MALDVLIVDDSAAIRKILHRVLVQAEVPLGKVHEASDGNEALEKMKTEKVGLILSDINMPNMDGIETLTEIRKQNLVTAGTKIIFLSNQNQQSDIDRAKALGVDGYIVKATSIPSEVVDEVKKIMANK